MACICDVQGCNQEAMAVSVTISRPYSEDFDDLAHHTRDLCLDCQQQLLDKIEAAISQVLEPPQ